MNIAHVIYFVLLLGCLFNGLRGIDLPRNGLYFTLSGEIYCDGDTILIENIGNDTRRDLHGNTVVCNTSYVNNRCCRNSDSINNSGPIGDWYYPDNSKVIANKNSTENNTFVRIGFEREVRLVKKGNVFGPLGIYTCRVPNSDGVIEEATINISSSNNPYSIVSASMQCTGAISTQSNRFTSQDTDVTSGAISTQSNSFTSQDTDVASGAISTNSFTSQDTDVTSGAMPTQSNSFTSQDTDVMSSTSKSAIYYTTKLTTSTNTAVIIASSITIVVVVIFILIVIVLTISLRTKLCQIIQFKSQKNFSASMSTSNKNENINAISNEKIELDTYANNEGQNNSSAEIHKVSCDEDTSRLYSVVDRSKKKEPKLSDDVFNPSNISEMYATVDKKAKGKIKPQDLTGSVSTVTDLYAVVDKKAKRKPTGNAADTTSSNISDMYAMVDKRTNANKTSEGSEQSVQGNTFSK